MEIWKEYSEAAKKERWKAFWALEDLPRPIWFLPATPALAVAVDWQAKGRSLTALFSDRDVQLHQELAFNKWFKIVQRLWSKDDFVLQLKPEMGVGAFASAFGCQIEFPWDQFPWSRPVIKAGQPASRVYELEPPDVHAGLLGTILTWAEYFDRKADYKYPIAQTDLQGPMDTAYLVWDSCDFMCAMYDHPKEVHHLMRLTTDLTIRFIKEFRAKVREFVPCHFPPAHLPDGMGIAVSEDALAVLSRPLWEEFSLPYLNELSEEFGGVVIHSCGNIAHQLEALKKVHKLRGLNFGLSETRFETVWQALGTKTCVIPHCSTEMVVARFDRALDWIAHVMKHKTSNKGLALMVVPIAGKEGKFAVKPTDKRNWSDTLELLRFGADVRKLIGAA